VNSNSTDTKEIQKFGVIALIFFGLLCGLGVWTKKPLPTYLFGFLSMLGFSFIVAPSRLRPIYGTWLKITHFLGRVVTTVILTLAYYLVITPAALVKRLFGGSPLPFKPDKDCPSYWVTREESAQPRERFLKRF
jgi:drug/metabolite transporter (DMT)-like permease